MKHPHPTASNFMVYKDYKTDLEYITSIINFKTQDFTCSFVYHHVIIHYYVFGDYPRPAFLLHSPGAFDYALSHQLFVVF